MIRKSRSFLLLGIASAWFGGCTSPDQVSAVPPPACSDWLSDPFVADSAHGAFNPAGGGFATGVSLGTRVYSWLFEVEQMCVSSPVADNAIDVDVRFRNAPPAGVAVIGYVYKNLASAEDPVTLATTPRNAAGSIDYSAVYIGFDLASASSDGKSANLLVDVEISFPTTGSSASDLAALKAALDRVEVDTYYHKYLLAALR